MKCRDIKDLIAREKVDMVLLKEMKLQEVNQRRCNALWGDSNCEWRCSPTVNSADFYVSGEKMYLRFRTVSLDRVSSS